MNIHDIFYGIIMKLEEVKDAAAGSFVYFLYGIVFHKRNVFKGLASFLIGTIFAMYVSPQIFMWVPSFHYNFVVFITGLLGMKLTEVLIEFNYKVIIRKKINQMLDIKEKDS